MAKQQVRRTKNKDNARRGKKKVSILLQEQVPYVDWKDVNLLRRFMSDRAKIRARRVTGNTQQQQSEIAMAIKNAREMALLPYTSRVTTQRTSRDRGERGPRADAPMPMPTPATPPPTGGAATRTSTRRPSSTVSTRPSRPPPRRRPQPPRSRRRCRRGGLMELILRSDVSGLGHRGDIVDVADGYGRNYLLPKGLAMKVTAGRPSSRPSRMAKARAVQDAAEREAAEGVATQLAGRTITIAMRAGDEGKLFGSVTAADVADAVAAQASHRDRSPRPGAGDRHQGARHPRGRAPPAPRGPDPPHRRGHPRLIRPARPGPAPRRHRDRAVSVFGCHTPWGRWPCGQLPRNPPEIHSGVPWNPARSGPE